MRTKEEASDYRYCPDPDLPLIHVDVAWIDRIKKDLPELPTAKFDRFIAEYNLSPYEAEILMNDRNLATYYEQAHTHTNSKQLINWVLRDVISYINEHKISILQCKVTPEKLAQIIALVEFGKINSPAAKEVFEAVAQTGANPQSVVAERRLEQIGSEQELEAVVVQLIAAHPEEVAQYKAGKEKLLGFFVGLAMKETHGKGAPQIIAQLVAKHLKS